MGNRTADRIIDAGVALFWRHGYDAVTVDAICASAKIGKGSFYHAFPTKEALLNATIRRVWEHDRAEIRAIYDDDSLLIDRFAAHLGWFAASQQRLADRYGFVPGMFSVALGVDLPTATIEVMRQARHDHLRMMQNVVHRIMAPMGWEQRRSHWLGWVATRFISGVVLDARMTNSLAPLTALPGSVFALMELGAPPAPPAITGNSTVAWDDEDFPAQEATSDV